MFQTAKNALNNGRSIGVENETGMVFQLADGIIQSCDLVAERLLGYSAKQLVDDDADSRDFITFVLEQAGAIVTPVASAIEALQAIEQSVFDLVVSDIGMPEIDGYALIQQIRALEPARLVPAIAAGFQAHIAKPVDPNAVIPIVVQFTKTPSARERSLD
ncbi:MAG: response regulator [Hassallia sp.]